MTGTRQDVNIIYQFIPIIIVVATSMVLSSLLQVREPLLSSLDGVDLDSGLAWLAAPSNDQLSTVRHVNAAGITAHCENIMHCKFEQI